MQLIYIILLFLVTVPGTWGKWVEGHVDTKSNWAFLSRFCFLSLEGQFEYLIEFDRDMGTPNLLLYYDDDSQWPAVYHSAKTCKEREEILNKAGQNQMIKLSYWYPDAEYSGCVVTKADKELPAEKSTTSAPITSKAKTTKKPLLNLPELPLNSSYYEQFLKTTKATTEKSITTITDANLTTWYELIPTDELNSTTTMLPDDELWETIGEKNNETLLKKIKDVELLFDKNSTHRVKRFSELYERFRHRRLNSESDQKGLSHNNVERLIVSCHNSRRFRSARERWWFIAISNCDSAKGLDIRYKFLMTNGPDGDFWHEHFSADEFYVLPVLLAYMFAYVIVMIAVVICSVELKSRHLFHSTYKLFLISIVAQHFGIVIQSLAYIRYAVNGVGSASARTVGQFLCGVSETTFLLLLVLLAKGYTVTRGRLKVDFTVKLTVFMCCYIVTYVVLFVYQAKAFDPGEVLYLYESPPGYGLIVLRVLAWCVFAYSLFFTVRKYPEKNTFYGPFFICSTLWFHAGPLFILTANSYIDKWVRESVVTAVLLLITFCGHIMFLLLTLPVFANKNFPYHVRTTQIGVMEVTGNPALDSFGTNAYHPSDGTAQTVIIPLTRRTEELIGNIYNQYMAPTIENGHTNGLPKRMDSMSPIPKTLNSMPLRNGLLPQDSTETNNSDDIKPYISKENNDIFTVENQMAQINQNSISGHNNLEQSNSNQNSPELHSKAEQSNLKPEQAKSSTEQSFNNFNSRNELPNVLRSKRNILEPIKRDDVPSWSFAKGPSIVAMQKKRSEDDTLPPINGFPPITSMKPKVPPVKNGLSSSGEISTIKEGHVQSYPGKVSQATVDLFTISKGKV